MSAINIRLTSSEIIRKRELGKDVTWPKIVRRGLSIYEYEKKIKEINKKR